MLIQSTPNWRMQPNSAKAMRVLSLLIMAQANLLVGTLPPILAQPGIKTLPDAPNTMQFPPLNPEQKTAINQAISLVRQEDLCNVPLNLKVVNASIEDIAAKIRANLPPRTIIEVRLTTPARFTLELAAMPAGQILNAVATLGGGKLYVLHDRLLLTAEPQLSEAERTEAKTWITNISASGGVGWSARSQSRVLLLRTIGASLHEWSNTKNKVDGLPAQQGTPLQLRVGDMSPELQQMTQYIVNWRPGGGDYMRGSQVLTPDTLIIFDDSKPNSYNLEIKSQSQGIHVGSVYRPGP
ncbi:MAG: hypothetical protein JOZ57_17540 [Abitibacteriaceae bacterium]|nr:hypothetical protein [Abditibacteriaceae bacterium]